MRLVLGCEMIRPTLKVDLECIIRVSEREELGVYGALLLSIHLIVVIYLLYVYDITSFQIILLLYCIRYFHRYPSMSIKSIEANWPTNDDIPSS